MNYIIRGFLLLALAIAPFAGTAAEPTNDIFLDWLAAFNSGETAAIQGFYAKRLDDPDAAYARHLRTETCGFDLARIENDSSLGFSALLVERCFPALRRMTFSVADDGVKLENFSLKSFSMSTPRAIAATHDIATRLAIQDEFAGSIIIAKDGVAPWSFNAGTLSREDARAIDADTPMLLASAGKMFTAVAVLQLVEQKKIELDAPLGRYVSDYPNQEIAKVTIRQLLAHRGGTGEDGILRKEESANRAWVRTIDDFIALNGDRGPDFLPGSKADYSNYGFILLGAVIERVSGQNYVDYLAEHIFKPAGMDETGFPDLDHMDDVATGYTSFFGEEDDLVSHRSVLPWTGSAAGGGTSTANDMLRFLRALQSGSLLAHEILKQATSASDTSWYGLGFFLSPSPHPMWGHGGFSYGMSVGVQRLPDDKTTIVCLSTRDMACDRIINAWYWRTFGLAD